MIDDDQEIEERIPQDDILETIDQSWADDGSDPAGFEENLILEEEIAEFERFLDGNNE